MQPKKVLHVVSTADFIDHFLFDNIENFNRRDYIFSVACSPSILLDELSKRGVFTSYAINITRSYTPLADLIAIKKLRRLIREHKFEVVIGHTPKGALLSMIAARLEKTKIRVYYRHGILYQTSQGISRKILKLMEKITAYCATHIINVSKSVADFAKQEKLNSSSKLIFLGTHGSCGSFNPILFSRNQIKQSDLNSFTNQYSLSKDKIYIGYFGRLVNDKGINDLIAAWEILLTRYNNICLLIAGDYEQRDRLPNTTKTKIGEYSSIIFLDYIKRLELVYACLDIFILPSYREGLPTVILEASSMELPIITTNVTGCVDAIINNETGLFCTHDPENIAEKISFYIEHPEIRKLHGQNGRKFVLANFDQSKIWDDFETKVLKL